MLNNVSGRVDTIQGSVDTINGSVDTINETVEDVKQLGRTKDSPIDQLFVKKVSHVSGNGEASDVVITSKKVIDFSALPTNNFYPVMFSAAYEPIQFTVTGTDGKGDDNPYNDCTLFGTLRNGGASDHRPFCMVTMKKFTSSEYRFLGVFRTNGLASLLAIYMRGGHRYTVSSPNSVTGYPEGYKYSPTTGRHSVFPVFPEPSTANLQIGMSSLPDVIAQGTQQRKTGDYELITMIDLAQTGTADGTHYSFSNGTYYH